MGDWEDQPLPEDDAIRAAFPTRTGDHSTYAEAMRLVGAKRSKGALVSLVNWLLVERTRQREAAWAGGHAAATAKERERHRLDLERIRAELDGILAGLEAP